MMRNSNEYFSFGGDIAADENTMEEAIAGF